MNKCYGRPLKGVLVIDHLGKLGGSEQSGELWKIEDRTDAVTHCLK